MEEFMRWLAARGIRDLTSQPPTLEELFLRHYAVRPDGTRQAKQVSP
jgi:ABC-2 type transport system ATP-binding protein